MRVSHQYGAIGFFLAPTLHLWKTDGMELYEVRLAGLHNWKGTRADLCTLWCPERPHGSGIRSLIWIGAIETAEKVQSVSA